MNMENIKQTMLRYWETHHTLDIFKDRNDDPLGLDVVCVPGMPLFYNKLLHFFNERTFAKLLKSVGSVRHKRVLDVGCGTGRWCRFLANRGAAVTGIDLSPVRMKDNKKEIPLAEFATMSVTDLEFRDCTFDLVTSVVVLQHVHHDLQKQAAKEIARVLRPGGHFLMIESTKEDEAVTYKYSFPNSKRQWQSLFGQENLELVMVCKSSNFFLLDTYILLRNAVAKIFFRKNENSVHSEVKIPAYDKDGLLRCRDIALAKKSLVRRWLKRMENGLLFLIVWMSYVLELVNQSVFKYYPVSESGYLFVKKS